MTHTTEPTLLATPDDVQISRALRAALGHECPAGCCQDCGGIGLVGSMTASEQVGVSLWRTCPGCLGRKHGGSA